ncbi:MAG: tetratricopeptide repeat protein [Candidatus Micrarchaeia archaeon]
MPDKIFRSNNNTNKLNNSASAVEEILELEYKILSYGEDRSSLINSYNQKLENIFKKIDIDQSIDKIDKIDEKKLFNDIINAIKAEKMPSRSSILYDFCTADIVSDYSILIIMNDILNKLNYPHKLELNGRNIIIKGKDVEIYTKFANKYYFILEENLKSINEDKSEDVYLDSNNKNINGDCNKNDAENILIFVKLYHAYFYLGAAKYDTVIELLKDIDKDKLNSNYFALNMLASSYFAKTNFKLAEEYIDKSIKINPSENSLALKGSILFYSNKPDDALKYFKKSLKLNDKNIISLRLSAYIYYNNGLSEKTLEIYNKLVNIYPFDRDFDTLYTKAVLEYNLNKEERVLNTSIENALARAKDDKDKEKILLLKANFLLRKEDADINEILKIADMLMDLKSQYFAGIIKIHAFNKSEDYDNALKIIDNMLKERETYELLGLKALALSKIKGREAELYNVINRIVNFAENLDSLNLVADIISKSEFPNPLKEDVLLKILESINYGQNIQEIIAKAALVFTNSENPDTQKLGFNLYNLLNNPNPYKILNEPSMTNVSSTIRGGKGNEENN